MSRYLIYAAEGIYQGEHGIFNIDIDDYSSLNEAEDVAVQMSADLMMEHLNVYDILDSSVKDTIENSGGNYSMDDYDDLFSDEITDNLYYDIYKLKPAYEDYPLAVLVQECLMVVDNWESFNAFINEHCEDAGY